MKVILIDHKEFEDLLARLERIVHPAVADCRAHFVRANRARAIIVFDIPLLFEKGGTQTVDAIMVVSAAAWQQRKRGTRQQRRSSSRLLWKPAALTRPLR